MPKRLAPPPPNAPRRFGSGPMLIRDHLPDLWCPVDDRQYDSKSAYYRTVREAGLEIVGNERRESYVAPPREPSEAEIVQDLKRAYEERGFGD